MMRRLFLLLVYGLVLVSSPAPAQGSGEAECSSVCARHQGLILQHYLINNRYPELDAVQVSRNHGNDCREQCARDARDGYPVDVIQHFMNWNGNLATAIRNGGMAPFPPDMTTVGNSPVCRPIDVTCPVGDMQFCQLPTC